MIRLWDSTVCTNLLWLKHKPLHNQFSVTLDVRQIPINHAANLAVSLEDRSSRSVHRFVFSASASRSLYPHQTSREHHAVSRQHKAQIHHTDPHIMLHVLCNLLISTLQGNIFKPPCNHIHSRHHTYTVIWLHSTIILVQCNLTALSQPGSMKTQMYRHKHTNQFTCT